MNRRKAVILAVAVSLAAHGVFLAASPHINLPGMSQMMDQTRELFRLRDVHKKTEDVNLFEGAVQEIPSVKMTSEGMMRDARKMDKMALREKMRKKLPVEKKKMEMSKEPMDDATLKEMERFDTSDVMKAEEKKARESVQPEKRSLADRLLSSADVESSARRSGTTGMDDSGGYVHSETGIMETGAWDPSSMGRFSPVSGQEDQGGRIGEYEDISSYLDVRLLKYEDPSTGEKYFKLLVSVKKDTALEVIPKEVTFLIDSSKSITSEKLEYIKKGLADSLRYFNKGDRFNVIAFRGDLVRFRSSPVPPSSGMIEEARSFIRDLEAVGQTDVENALFNIVKQQLSYHPSYVILVTDGRPTTGITDSRRIIQQITRENNMRRPIFCFGGGLRVNKYLLDFISYQNRAWSRFTAATYDMADNFEAFYRQIKDPVLVNVRYRLSGMDPSEVYPKYLSDFYQRKPFVLYGKFVEENIFSVQLLGEVNGSTKELILKRSLDEAEPGGEEVAKEWAFHKIYYMISRNTMGLGDPSDLRREIEELSRRYGIVTPYDIEDKD